MDCLQKLEIYGEEYVGFASFYEIRIIVLLLLALKALLGDYGSIDAFDRCYELVEIAYHDMAIRYIGLQLPK
jgi:hypothetical protein